MSTDEAHSPLPPQFQKIIGHFGEFLQGLYEGEMALISVPCSQAELSLSPSFDGENWINQKQSAHFEAELASLYEKLKITKPHAITVKTTMPFGGGCGYSTALRLGLVNHYFPRLSLDDKLEKLQTLEEAVDPLCFEHFEQVLWGSRIGKIFHQFPPLPAMKICGGFWGEGVRTQGEDRDFPIIDDLIEQWQKAKTLEDYAQIATKSAERLIAHRHIARDPIWNLAQKFDALGVVLAHTGSARGLIFPMNSQIPNWQEAFADYGFHNLMEFETGGAH